MAENGKEAVFSEGERKLAWIILPLLVVGLIATWVLVNNPKVGRLNDVLRADTELAAYPYPFHVVAVEGEVAVMSSPRSAQSSVLQALKVIAPELNVMDTNSDAVVAAQKELARLQTKAQELIVAQPEISDVRWELDRSWLLSHGAILDQ